MSNTSRAHDEAVVELPRIADRFILAFFLEKVSGNPSMLEIVERLADAEREDAPKLTFEETAEGWRAAA